MSTRKLQLQISGFPFGLNTEATPLTVLPSEFMDGTENVELQANTSVRRRKGVDFFGQADSGSYLVSVRTDAVINERNAETMSGHFVRLRAPNGNLLERIIVDVNNTFRVYEATLDSLSNFDVPSQTLSRGVNSFSDMKDRLMTYAESDNKLYFTGLHCQPGYIEVDTDNTSLKIVFYDVIIRDPDAQKANDRVKNTISTVDRWFDCIEDHTSAAANEPGVGADWERYWIENTGALPSGIPTWSVSSVNYETEFIKRYNKLTTLTATDLRPTTVEFFAGRIWLGGDPKFPNLIYFTQVVVRDNDIVRFHQFADPYDSTDPDVVDSDGGVMRVQGAGYVVRILAAGTSLYFGTTNSVFQVTGPDGIFKATDFSITRVLDENIGGPTNMVRIDQELLVFGEHSIWLSNTEKSIANIAAGRALFIDVAEDRINTLYKSIPVDNKTAAMAIYNNAEQRVYYYYTADDTVFSNTFNPNNQPNYFTNILVLDVRFLSKALKRSVGFDDPLSTGGAQNQTAIRRTEGAFFPYTFDDTGDQEKPYLTAPFILPNPATEVFVVDDSGNQIVDDSSNLVVADFGANRDDIVINIGNRRSVVGNNLTVEAAFIKLKGTGLKDWTSDTTYAISYDSKITFGMQSMGDALHHKGGAYLYLLFGKVETGLLVDNVDITPGGAFLRTAHQYAKSTKSQRYGNQKQVYYPYRYPYAYDTGENDGHDHVWFKNRIRGRSRSIQFILENDGDKDFHLIGWNHQFWGKVD